MTNIRSWKLFFTIIAVLVFLFCYTWYEFVPSNVRAFRDFVDSRISNHIETELQKGWLAANWRPPDPEADSDVLFPQFVDAWVRESHDIAPVAPEFGTELESRHAVYRTIDEKQPQKQGVTQPEQRIDVYLCALNDEEKGPFFEEVVRGIEEKRKQSGHHFRMTTGNPRYDRFSYTIRPPLQNGIFWWRDGCLVYLRTNADFELDSFLTAYLLAIQKQGDETEPPASNEPPAR